MHSLDSSSVKARWKWSVKLGVLALCGIVGLLLATRWDIGVSPDSAIYLGAANNLLAGRGLSVPFGDSVDSPLTHYPPFYPVLLAVLGWFGLEPMDGARGLNALLFGGNSLLVALALYQARPRSARLPVIGAGLLLISPSMFSLHAMAWTEALFIFLSLAGLLTLARYLETAEWKYGVASSLLMACALLTRYAGVALLTASVVGLVLFATGTIRRRLGLGLTFGLVGFAPTLVWAIRNWLVADTIANRSFAFHPITTSHLWQALGTASAWLLIPAQASTLIKLGGMLIVLGGLAVVVYPRLTESASTLPASWTGLMKRTPIMIKLLLLFIGVYALFLAGSISFLDANTPLDERILSPIYVSVLIIGVSGLGWVLERPARPMRLVLAMVGLMFGLLSIYRLSGMAADAYANGLGFNHRLWRESETLAQVEALPPGTLIYSNAPEAVYLHTGRSALRLPRLTRLMEQQVNSSYPAELAEMQRRLAAEAGVVVYFDAVRGQSLPTVEALRESLALALVYDAPDGDLYTLATEH